MTALPQDTPSYATLLLQVEKWSTATNSAHKITPFAAKVYSYVAGIPSGKIATYKMIAEAIGSPGASRAVGTALKNNPYAPKIPCFRVIASDFSIGSFMGGVENSKTKVRLLILEGIKIENGKVARGKEYRDGVLFKSG